MDIKMNETLKKLKKSLAARKPYLSRCQVCRKPFGKGFTFHHKWYINDDAKHGDFKSSLEYYKALAPYIFEEPGRFSLLCRNHHYFVEWGISLNDESFERFVKLVRECKRKR